MLPDQRERAAARSQHLETPAARIRHLLERAKLRRLKTKPATTLDGLSIELQANIELPGDLSQALDNGATGVGLFRS